MTMELSSLGNVCRQSARLVSLSVWANDLLSLAVAFALGSIVVVRDSRANLAIFEIVERTQSDTQLAVYRACYSRGLVGSKAATWTTYRLNVNER